MSEVGAADAKLYVLAIPHIIHSGAEVSAITQNLIASFEHEPLNRSFTEYLCAYIKALAIIHQ